MSDLIFESPVVTKPAARPDAPLVLADLTASTRVVVTGEGARTMGVTFGRSRRDGDVLVCGSRPDEVTLMGPLAQADAMMGMCSQGGMTTVIDWTHRGSLFRLTGEAAATTLNKLCGVDFGDHMIPDGAVFPASVGGVGCDLVREDEGGKRSYWIGADRSFGQYLFDTLLDAGGEFDIGVA